MCPRPDITAWVYDTVKDVDLPPEEYEARRVSGRARADMLAKDYGVECSVFDHSESSFDADVYAKAVASANVYYTDGGNTWALQHWWRMHGTHKMVGDRVRAGEMVSSAQQKAGSVAVCLMLPAGRATLARSQRMPFARAHAPLPDAQPQPPPRLRGVAMRPLGSCMLAPPPEASSLASASTSPCGRIGTPRSRGRCADRTPERRRGAAGREVGPRHAVSSVYLRATLTRACGRAELNVHRKATPPNLTGPMHPRARP